MKNFDGLWPLRSGGQNMKDHKKAAVDAAKGATKGAAIASASAILTGVAMTSVPVKLLGLFTVATTTLVSASVLVPVAVGGAVVGGGAAAYLSYRKQARTKKQFDEMVKGVGDDQPAEDDEED